MRYLVVLSYDLIRAPSAVYEEIKEELAGAGLSDVLKSRRGMSPDLPASTFIGVKSGKSSKHIKDELSSQLDRFFTKNKIEATYLLTVGNEWSLKVKRVKA